MSFKTVDSFFRMVEADEEMTRRVIQCQTRADEVAFAARHGYVFTVGELEQAIAKAGTLDDEELDKYSAGIGYYLNVILARRKS